MRPLLRRQVIDVGQLFAIAQIEAHEVDFFLRDLVLVIAGAAAIGVEMLVLRFSEALLLDELVFLIIQHRECLNLAFDAGLWILRVLLR